MSWWSTVPVLAVTTAVMMLPGLLLAIGLRFRGMAVVGLAPLFSVAVAGVAAVIGSVLGISWSIWLVAAAAVIFSLLAFVLTRWWNPRGRDLRQSAPDRSGNGAAAVVSAGAGALIGGALIAWRTVTLIGNPENIAQLFDNVFHLNAVEYIVATGDASSLTLGEMTGNAGRAAVYPAAWHSLGALVVQLTGTSVPIAVNAVNLVISAIVWPVSIVFLTRVLWGPRPVVLFASGTLSAAFIGFPYLMMVWGPLFPYMLSIALLPAAVAVVLLLVRMGKQIRSGVISALLAALVAVAALGLSHMSTVSSLLLISSPALVVALVRYRIPPERVRSEVGRALLKIAAALAGLGLFLFLWFMLRPVPYDVWGPHTTPGGAVGEVLAFSPMGFPLVPIAVSLTALAGLVHLLRGGEQRWVLVSFAVVGYLYVVDAGLDRGPWRAALTGIWYADTNRLAALLPIFGVAVGGLGVGVVLSWFRSRIARSVTGRQIDQRYTGSSRVVRVAAPTIGVAIMGLVLVTTTQSKPLETYLEGGEEAYLRDSPTSILSSDEYQLLERIDHTLPDDAVIAGNTWNGSTLAFAFTGRKVLSYHLFETQSPAVMEVSEALRDAPADAEACSAIRETGVSHVLDFGEQYLIEGAGMGQFPGFDNLEDSAAVRLIDQQGEAKLYEVVVCQS